MYSDCVSEGGVKGRLVILNKNNKPIKLISIQLSKHLQYYGKKHARNLIIR